MPRAFLAFACAALVGCSGGGASSSGLSGGSSAPSAADAAAPLDGSVVFGPYDAGFPEPILLNGDETLTFELGTPPYALVVCPADGVIVLDTKVVISLASRSAWKTVVRAPCIATETTPSTELGASPPTTTSGTIVDSQRTELISLIQGAVPERSTHCSSTGDVVLMTIDPGDGHPRVYEDEQGPGCPPIVGVLQSQAMLNIFSLASYTVSN
jgi:hypothetical protein